MTLSETTFVAETPYQGEEYRSAYEGRQQGVMGAGDLKVTQVAGRNFQVAAGVGYVAGDAAGQGLYRCPRAAAIQSDNFDTGPVPAPGANPRLHQIIARVYDHEWDGLGLRGWRPEVVPGAATAGATLDNRNGAGVLPDNSMILVDILQQTNGALTWRDRRPWARGAYKRIQRNANASAGNDYTVTGAWALLDAANMQSRLELSGVPVRLRLTGSLFVSNTASAQLMLDFADNGASLLGAGAGLGPHYYGSIGLVSGFDFWWDFIPAAGSHLLGPAARAITVNSLLYARADMALLFTAEELLRPNASND